MTRELLSGVDAAWLQMDRTVNTADVVSVIRLEGRLTLPRLRRLLQDVLLAHARFRQRIVDGPLGRPAWEADPDFSLERHAVQRRLDDAPGALDAYVSAVASDRLDPAHPPWRVHLLHVGRDSALVLKLHHCIADGLALVSVLLSLADEELPGGHHSHRTTRDLRSPTALLGVPVAASASLARMVALPPDASSPLKRPLSGQRRVACSRPIPLRAVRAAARERHVTINELLGAALAGALRRWLEERGDVSGARDIRALVPVNLRPHGDEASLGNAFGLVFLDLPVGTPAQADRVGALHARMDALKKSPDALVTYNVLSVLGRLPVALEQVINAFFTSKASLVLTNVPGPREPLQLAGHRIQHLMFWVPHPASLGLGVSILSYAGEVVMGVRADTAVMPDPAALVRSLEAELAELAPDVPARRAPRAARQPVTARATGTGRAARNGRASRNGQASRSGGPSGGRGEAPPVADVVASAPGPTEAPTGATPA